MKILSHRGFWKNSEEKNSLTAIKRALDFGFGFESDIRDYQKGLVISHDIPDDKSVKADMVFEILKEYHNNFCFAINIKSDGLANILKEKLKTYGINNYFTFDMSLPQMLCYKNIGIKYFTRQSEYEKTPLLYEDAAGVWLDTFNDDKWITDDIIKNHLANNKAVSIVSPELHGRDAIDLWQRLLPFAQNDKFFLCADEPDKAKDFFVQNGVGL